MTHHPFRLFLLVTLVAASAALAPSCRAAPGSTVLLDEEWKPEIKQNNVQVTVVDAAATGDRTQAKEGTKSVLLQNAEGWPNVRFANAGSIVLGQVSAGKDRVSLWYRTDAWDGNWQADIWVYYPAAGQPVKVLEAPLDGGGPGGRLIADDQWHQASGALFPIDRYDQAPKGDKLPVFFWLVPKSGWGKKHRTFVDRVEIVTSGAAGAVPAAEAPKPAVPVKPNQGAQVNGAGWIWWEAEDAVAHTFTPSNAFTPANAEEQSKLSNGAWLQHDKGAGLTGKWVVDVPEAAGYAFWSRKFWKHGPFRWRWNGGEWRTCGRDVALADEVSLRLHLGANWVYLGEADLPKGKSTLEVEVLPGATAVAFDCWLLSKGPFLANGANKPGTKYNRTEEGWFAFEPDSDAFRPDALLDLRSLNQKRAGDDGFVQARGMDFVFEKSGKPVRFWAVNTSYNFDDRAAVRYLARRLAKLGVNMIRVHGRVWDEGAPDLKTVDQRHLDQLHYLVAAMADEGIYTKVSLYFPLWVSMRDEYGFPGYKKGEHPFALLFYHPRFQEIYRSWLRAVMTTKNPHTGRSLAEDPAVAIVEVVNEDNFLFWTFRPGENPPAEMMAPLEDAFGKWLTAKHGSLEAAVAAWGGNQKAPKGDDFAAGRVALYSAGQLTGQDWARNSRNPKRASDQLQFLTEHLRGFYEGMVAYLRKDLGVRCCISATNWKSADPRVHEALDKYTNMACDVIDRHEYLGNGHEGEGAGYSVRVGHTYADLSGLRGPTSLTKELQYTGHPHIVSEYNYPMPNRFRAESPWLAALYGSLNGTDGYYHFAVGEADWLRGHTKFSVGTPVIMGQFPGLALAYRLGYVREGPVVYHAGVKLADLYQFKGTPISQEQNLDELRKADIPRGGQKEVEAPTGIDPLAYYVGQVTMTVADDPGPSKVSDLTPYLDREAKVVRSATGELAWDWGKGISTLNAAHAQGACGFLKDAGAIDLKDVRIEGLNEYGAVLLVSLDGQPLATSGRMLLQVITEDRNYGWKTVDVTVKDQPRKRILSLGAPPLLVRNVAGTVSLKRGDAGQLKVTALDANGYRKLDVPGGAGRIGLQPDCLYYVISR